MIICLTGPGGSGKSTVAQHLVQKFKYGVHINVDTIKHLIVTGFHYDDSPKGKEQWELCTDNIIQLIINYAQAGYDIVLEGFLGNHDRICWDQIFAVFPETHKFLLLPDRSTVIDRDQKRAPEETLGEDIIRCHMDFFEDAGEAVFPDFQLIDSSKQTSEQTAGMIQSAISL